MGSTLMGSAKHKGNAPLMTPEQNQFLAQILGGSGNQAGELIQQLLQPSQGGNVPGFAQENVSIPAPIASQEQLVDPAQANALFQQSYVDPAMATYEQQVLPAIQQRFVDANAGSSSALNQALSQSAVDLSTMLGGQRGQFTQQQQENQFRRQGIGQQDQQILQQYYNQLEQQQARNQQNQQFQQQLGLQGQQLQQSGQLGGLGFLGSLVGQKSFDPIIQQRQGILGPLIGAVGQAAGGYATGMAMASSRKIKENIKDFKEGLGLINEMDVKQYDYKGAHKWMGKDKIGFIAEDLPKDIQQDIDGVLGVDVYGLLAISINAIKELSKKVELLEAK